MKKIFTILLTIFVAAGAVLTPAASARSLVYAEEESYDDTRIEDDLKDIDILQYPANPFGEASLVSMMEYCYSDRLFLTDDYGLYFYVYNPTEKPLRTEVIANTVELAISYDDEGKPVDYEPMALVYLDCTDNHRFYKFRLQNPLPVLQQAKTYAQAHDGDRRYDISGIQLWAQGEDTAHESNVSLTYRWSGYAQNCSAEGNSESTLLCSTDDLITLDIPLYHNNESGKRVENQTYYRTGASSLGSDHRWQIDSVYFSVDEDSLFEEAGSDLGILQKIKARWYEYQTKPVYVTSSENLKAAYTPYIGVDISDWTGEQLYELGYGMGKYETRSGDETIAIYNWSEGYGLFEYPYRYQAPWDIYYISNEVEQVIPQIDWLFKVAEAGENKITSAELLDYAKDYSQKFGVSETDEYLAQLGYSDELFTDGTAVHADGKAAVRGLNEFEFDTDATFDLSSYDSTLDGWDKFVNFWYGIDNGESWEIDNFSPILNVTESDLSSLYSDEELAERLQINENDAAEFRRWAKSEIDNGQKVYLFRFAVTDYIHEQLDVLDYNKSGPSSVTHPVSRAQQAVFLGFEMITLTYNDRGTLTVIPVVQSPIHVFDDIDVDLKDPGFDWWKVILAILGLILLLVVIMPILPYVVNAIVWVIRLPFVLIGSIVKAFRKPKKKRK